nr:hypothetical protein [uncultured Brumimicrobium sp.]
MKQYQIEGNKLILKVKKSPLFIRIIFFTVAILFFIMPLAGMLMYISLGNGFHIGFLMGVFFFGIMGFYILRMALWNTYGKETITFNKDQIKYIADYGWFKDGSTSVKTPDSIDYSIRNIGYEDEHKGALIIGGGERPIFCVTKMKNEEINELIEVLLSDISK